MNKSQTVRAVQPALPGRTFHTLLDRCYRSSEVLSDHGLPWVKGWKPPAMVNQTPNSPGVSKLIWEVVEPMLATELPSFRPTSGPSGALPQAPLAGPPIHVDVAFIHRKGRPWPTRS